MYLSSGDFFRVSLLIFTFRIKSIDASKLQDEYAKLVEGLQEAYDADTDGFMVNPGNVNCKVWLSSNRLITLKPFLKIY